MARGARRAARVVALIALCSPAPLLGAGAPPAAAASTSAASTAAASTSAAAAAPCTATAKVQLRQTAHYRITLSVGPVPPMYSLAEYLRLKPRRGVVMLEPMVTTMPAGMSAGAGQYHLRVQVCSRATGKPVRSPRPTVALAVSMMRQTLPLTLGYDIGSPPTDLRFCQVLSLPDGRLGVLVQAAGETAAFSVTLG